MGMDWEWEDHSVTYAAIGALVQNIIKNMGKQSIDMRNRESMKV